MMAEAEKTKIKLDYKRTFLIGFGFLTTGLAWNIYNVKVPLVLKYFLPAFTWTDFIIGIIMVLDNITAILLQPYFGAVSDRTKSKFGKRMPFIITGIPLGVVSFVLIPHSTNLALLVFFIMLYNIGMALYRSPVVALMPDLTPSEVRAKGNAVINLMGGFGTIGSFLIGAILLDMDPTGSMAFSVIGLIMLGCLFVVFFTVNENEITKKMIQQYGADFAADRTEAKAFRVKELQQHQDVKKSLGERIATSETVMIFREKEKSALFMLLAIFSWFFAYNAIETFFSLLATEVLGFTQGTASLLMLFLPLSFIIFALPAGIISEKIGRRKTIKMGLAIIIGAATALLFVFVIEEKFIYIIVMFLVIGVAWSMVNINSITVVWQLAPDGKIGAYTGVYYLFSASAAITSPVVAGFLFSITSDVLGAMRYALIFPFMLAFITLALIFMLFVRRGEVNLSKAELEALKKAYESAD